MFSDKVEYDIMYGKWEGEEVELRLDCVLQNQQENKMINSTEGKFEARKDIFIKTQVKWVLLILSEILCY